MNFTGGAISVRAINNCGVGADRSLSIAVGAIFPPSGIDVTPGTCTDRVYTYTVSQKSLPIGGLFYLGEIGIRDLVFSIQYIRGLVRHYFPLWGTVGVFQNTLSFHPPNFFPHYISFQSFFLC